MPRQPDVPVAVSRICILHQGFIPHYRVRFFERLAVAGEIEIVVVHGQAPSGSGHVAAPGPFRFGNLFRRSLELRFGDRQLIYQPVVREVLRGGFDAAVIGQEFKLLSNVILLALFKATGRPVLIWGHGYHRESAHWLARMASTLVARLADGYLVYTEGGARRLREIGLPENTVFIVNNTIDMSVAIAARERHRDASVQTARCLLGLRPEATTLLYIGRIYARKRCTDLLEIVRRLQADPAVGEIDLAIVGDGPDCARLEVAAAGLENVRFFGVVHDPDRLALLMKAAAVMVNPGSAGLAINHCFAHGVPVLARVDMQHSPEIDYIVDGENGFVVAGDLDTFIAALRRVLVDDALREHLGRGALATAARLNLDHMVAAFAGGVRATLARRPHASANTGTQHSGSATELAGRRPRVRVGSVDQLPLTELHPPTATTADR